MFKKVLIANRGEIAVRILRTCRDLGLPAAVVYSEADLDSLHVRLADEAHFIGGARADQSYLSVEKVLAAAKAAGADAIHPGYGFLSENARFASACEDAGLVFIGPSVSSLRLMGDKIASRRIAEEVEVPVIPGTPDPVRSPEEAVRAARRIGFPIMVKASGGGGGKGLRVVLREEDLEAALSIAGSEAHASFQDSRVFLEKYLQQPRHVEVQVLGDRNGDLIHLGERECSTQRRHQKLVEEAPSPVVTPDLRAELGRAAVAVARASGYYNAGTVEFLVEKDREYGWRFYFLEMNTRLQVEHPVTELVTGIDLVREQLRIAAGEPLGWKQEDVRMRGHALECRIYAEDPDNDFLPAPGRIRDLLEPGGPGVRLDSGVYAGVEVPVHYDPLISKLVTYGPDRREALRRMKRALDEYRIAGVTTTIPFFRSLMENPGFVAGELNTGLVDELMALPGHQEQAQDPAVPLAAAAIHRMLEEGEKKAPTAVPGSAWKTRGPFSGLQGGWSRT
ncbi:MAG: acetyl-CoA carboxylase biotin carboxylase subunit [Acidobacteriota bacterium]|nr:acetyl-CoA carboxylase biotin carboxylase subunit [Acidobacteriota bacterium]